MQAETDLVILGGGCAGLSLAIRLAALGLRCPRTLILESRTEYTNDRTWCFWDDGSTAFSHLISHRWQRMTLRAADRRVAIDCGSTPYQMLPAGSFYTQALEEIAKTGRIDLVTNASVLAEPRRVGDKWRIETTAGPFWASMAIDTRPGQVPRRGGATLWQSFYGLEIECDAAVFDPGCANLMEFSDGDPAGVHFTYVLPVSPHRALVEATVFGPDPLRKDDLAAELESAIARRVGGAGFAVKRAEHGILPMGLASAPTVRDATHVKVGLTAGGARPSTGYAFQRIQRWADACAEVIGKGGAPIGHAADPPLLRAMDRLFLAVIRARPEAAPSLFLSLFEKADARNIIRFMSDRGTFRDYAAIASALPTGPFVKEIPGAFMRRPLQPEWARGR
jgi:lycopene beta-cyclase